MRTLQSHLEFARPKIALSFGWVVEVLLHKSIDEALIRFLKGNMSHSPQSMLSSYLLIDRIGTGIFVEKASQKKKRLLYFETQKVSF